MGWTDHYIEGENIKTVLINGKPAKKLKNGFFLVSFGNFIGLSELVLVFEEGRTIKMPVEVISPTILKRYHKKWAKEQVKELSDLQNSFVEALTHEILRYSSTLPFHLESPTEFSTMESDEPVNELFAYHYLRSNGERIIGAFETVMHRMKRKLVVEEKWMKPDEVDEVAPETLIAIAQHPEYLAPAGEGVLVGKYLNGYVPTRVFALRKYESVDTPENRFVKYFLNLLIEWGERVVETFGKTNVDLNPVEDLLGELEFLRSDGLWDEVGEMTLFPYTSQTLLKGDGYRDLLELYREFTAYSPFFEGLQRAIDNKDIAKLYEYWAFFRLVDELGRILGRKKLKIVVTPAGELSESGDVYAEFDNGWRLYYNKKLTPKRWSYSVSLRPDFSLFSGNPSKKDTELIGVFDAKFKVDIVDEQEEIEEFDEETSLAEETRSYETWAKLEDIYKMHTYRDALRCRFAVVVYPGEEEQFFDVKIGRINNFDIEDILIGNLEGIGYLRRVPRDVYDSKS
ncbi:DUF2357 domain-containing protein [Thermococcus sp. PK]|nr:DUF2357 domain-containing protein [Thermococcus sp. PK]